MMINNDLLKYIKNEYKNTNHNISDKYFYLMQEYISSIIKIDNLYVNYFELIKTFPNVLTEVSEEPLDNVYGYSYETTIVLAEDNNEKENTKHFFHELTHVLQSYNQDGIERCGFYDGVTGMFLTEGATQYLAEILYAVYKKEELTYKTNENYLNNHKVVSILNDYSLNGNILLMLSKVLNIPIYEMLALSYGKSGRDKIKHIYDSIPEMEGTFENLMYDLEKLYLIDAATTSGYEKEMQNIVPYPISLPNTDQKFYGNYEIFHDLMDKVQKELMLAYIFNNNVEYILNNYGDFLCLLSSEDLQHRFLTIIRHIAKNNIQTHSYELDFN